MANINQPAPGTPEGPSDEATLIAEDFDTSTGVLIHRQLWSDGTRRTVRDGVEEHSPVLTDLQKVQATDEPEVPAVEEDPKDDDEPEVPAVEEDPKDDDESKEADEKAAKELAEATEAHNEAADEAVAEGPAADPTIAATVLAMHGGTPSGDLSDFGGQTEYHEPPQGADEPILDESWEQPMTEALLEDQPLASEAEADESVVNNSDSDGDDSFVQDVEDEGKKLWQSVKDFEFKTVQELKDFASEHNINLHGATKKDDIVDAIKQEDKHDA